MFSVTSQVFQMNTYAKFNDYTQLRTTAKCNYFVKINIYNQTFVFGLILIFFFPLGLAWNGPALSQGTGWACQTSVWRVNNISIANFDLAEFLCKYSSAH